MFRRAARLMLVPEMPTTTMRRMARAVRERRNASSSAEKAAGGGGGGWWTSAEFWGGAGALAGWGMTGAAIWDASTAGPELISMNMTSVMLVYSSLFARWAWVVQPRNVALCACHVSNVAAQANQMRRAINFKLEKGEADEVQEVGTKAAVFAAGTAALIVGGPALQSAMMGAGAGPLSAMAAAPAGPFTVHFWAPMSKWLISGASFLDLNRPVENVSLMQYTALTATGFFFSRYAMLVTPINYLLCSVNIALFSSSAWHLGRKIKADYVDEKVVVAPAAAVAVAEEVAAEEEK
jgi:hypothetical protein